MFIIYLSFWPKYNINVTQCLSNISAQPRTMCILTYIPQSYFVLDMQFCFYYMNTKSTSTCNLSEQYLRTWYLLE